MAISWRSIRIPTLAVLTLSLLAGSSAVAVAGHETPPPEQQTGTPGTHLLGDVEADPSVRCVYQATPPPPLQRFRMDGPRVSWPNLHPANHTESGHVTWKVLIQKQTEPTLHVWRTVKRLPARELTAHEGSISGFTKRTIPWVKPGVVWYRLVTLLTWKRGDGTVVGSVRHWVQWYAWVGVSPSTVSGGCISQDQP